MSDKNPSKVNWAQVEAELCSRPSDVKTEHDVQVYQTRAHDFDYRKAEALCLIHPTDLLQTLRTQLSRGHLNQAKEFLTSYESARPEIASDPEWKLELARLHAYFGEWELCVQACARVLALDPTGITRMTALQTRSIALFETLKWSEALRDIELIRSFGTLYPRASTFFYAEVLAAKILAAQGAQKQSEELLLKLWAKGEASQLSEKDLALTLLRAEAYVARHFGRRARESLLAAHSIAEKIGDEQYAALTRYEIYCSGDRSASLVRRLPIDEEKFARVALLRKDVESGSPKSATAQSLFGKEENSERDFSKETSLDVIFIPSRKVLIHLEPWSFQILQKLNKPLQALASVGGSTVISKAELFSALCGPQKYVSHLHDGLLYQNMSRLRRQWKIPVSVRDNEIELTSTIVIEAKS